MNVPEVLNLSAKQSVYVLSPHLDDAIWSLGPVLKSLTQAGHEVCIITIFSDTTQPQTRQAEDAKAAKQVGCLVEHLGFSDAILDGREVHAVFDENFKPSPGKIHQIAERVKKIVPEGGVVLAPSGFGVHVDHLATRAVTDQLAARVAYYEDLPYAARKVRLANGSVFLESRGLRRHSIAASSTAIAEHISLYKVYSSQQQPHHITQISDYLGKAGYGLWV